MMLMIREDDLTLVLAKRRNFIGVRPLWDSILIFSTGLFYIPAAVVIPNEICKWIMIGFGALVTGYGIVEICGRRFTTENLYKEIAGMNIISSSIVAIAQPGVPDSNQYLLYYDAGWDCWFFPNPRLRSVRESSHSASTFRNFPSVPLNFELKICSPSSEHRRSVSYTSFP